MISLKPQFPEPGLFSQRLTNIEAEGKPCLFLDRDGVLVEETNYLHRTADVAIIAGVPDAIARVNRMGIPVVMVTNQAGIGRGYYDWAQFIEVQTFILELCAKHGAHYDMVLACAYHAQGITPYNQAAHPWRKPGCGMMEEAANTLGVDLSRSHIIGDTLADLGAGAKAHLSGGTLVATGHGESEWRTNGEAAFDQYCSEGAFEVGRAANAADAIDLWLERISPAIHASE